MFNFFKKETILDKESREQVVITVTTLFALENIRNSNLEFENEIATVYQLIAHLYNQFQDLFKEELKKIRKDKSNQRESVFFMIFIKDFLEKKFGLTINIDPTVWLPIDIELLGEIRKLHNLIADNKSLLAAINTGLGSELNINDIFR